MKNWQFLLEAPGESPLVISPGQPTTVTRGLYRIRASSPWASTWVEVLTTYDTKEHSLRHRYCLCTNADGSLEISPLINLSVGDLRVRVSADILSELVDQYWQVHLTLSILESAFSYGAQDFDQSIRLNLSSDLLVNHGDVITLSGQIESLNYYNCLEARFNYQLYDPRSGLEVFNHDHYLDNLAIPYSFSFNLNLQQFHQSLLLLGTIEVELEVGETRKIVSKSKNFTVVLSPRALQQYLRQLRERLLLEDPETIELFNVRAVLETELTGDLVPSNKMVLPPQITPQPALSRTNKQPLKLPPSGKTEINPSLTAAQLQHRFWSRINSLALQGQSPNQEEHPSS